MHPAPYPVLLVDGGAAHVAVDGFFLGTAVTEESEGQPSANATADDGDTRPTMAIRLTLKTA